MKSQAWAGLLAGYLSSLVAVSVLLMLQEGDATYLAFMPCIAVPGGILGVILGILAGQTAIFRNVGTPKQLIWSSVGGLIATILLLPFLMIALVAGLPIIWVIIGYTP